MRRSAREIFELAKNNLQDRCITVFGHTSEEILEAIEYSELHNPKWKQKIKVISEYVGIDGQSYKLETWLDKGLTLWVNDKIVYQHNKD